jgi:hypothetical protein
MALFSSLLAVLPSRALHAQARPDLQPRLAVASSNPITVNPPQTAAGGTITVPLWSVVNNGTARASSFSVGVYLSPDTAITNADVRLGGVANISLDPGVNRFIGPQYLVVPLALPAGTYEVGVVVDDANAVAEISESNNSMIIAAPLVVTAPTNVDLRPRITGIAAGNRSDSVSFGTSVDAAPGGVIHVGGTVENAGSQDAPPFEVGFYVSLDRVINASDVLIGTAAIDTVQRSSRRPLGRTEVSLRDNLGNPIAPGPYFLGIVVDHRNAVDERSGGGEANNSVVTPITILAIPADTTPVWRVQLVMKTADVSRAGTDDMVRVRLNENNETIVDYGRDDFERRDSFVYDMVLDSIRTFSDIRKIEITKNSTDGWCTAGLELRLNGVTVFLRDFSPCRWIDPGQTFRDLVISYADLRHHARWAAYATPPLANLLLLQRADLESIIEANVGNALAGTAAEWGKFHGRAVEVSRHSSADVLVDLDLKTRGALPSDVELDVDFVVGLPCTCGALRTSISGLDVTVDSAWYEEVLSGGVVEVLDRALSGLIQDRLSEQLDSLEQEFDLGFGFCPTVAVFDNGDIQFGFPVTGALLSLGGSASPSRLRPGDTVTVTATVRNDGNLPSGAYSSNIFLSGSRPTAGSALGTRVGGSNRPGSLLVCGIDSWDEPVVLPATLECGSHGANSVAPMPGTLDRPSRGSPGPYYLTVQLNGAGVDPSRNLSQHRLEIGRPDLVLRRPPRIMNLSGPPYSVALGSVISVDPIPFSNDGLFGSRPLRSRYFLQLPHVPGSAVDIGVNALAALPANQVSSVPAQQLTIPFETRPGSYLLGVVVEQADGTAECNLDNNTQTVPIEVHP